MLNLNQPNTTILDEPANRDTRLLDYAVLSLRWLYWSWRDGNPHLAQLNPHFMDAVEALILFFDGNTNLPAPDAADRLRQHLAFWRRDLDATAHPFTQLGRVLQGDPGEFLEYRGPVFVLTFNEVLEGITHEYVAPEWDLNNPRAARFFISLAAIVLSEISITCYWVLRAQGTHLDTELQRFSGQRTVRRWSGSSVISSSLARCAAGQTGWTSSRRGTIQRRNGP